MILYMKYRKRKVVHILPPNKMIPATTNRIEIIRHFCNFDAHSSIFFIILAGFEFCELFSDIY